MSKNAFPREMRGRYERWAYLDLRVAAFSPRDLQAASPPPRNLYFLTLNWPWRLSDALFSHVITFFPLAVLIKWTRSLKARLCSVFSYAFIRAPVHAVVTEMTLFSRDITFRPLPPQGCCGRDVEIKIFSPGTLHSARAGMRAVLKRQIQARCTALLWFLSSSLFVLFGINYFSDVWFSHWTRVHVWVTSIRRACGAVACVIRMCTRSVCWLPFSCHLLIFTVLSHFI